MQRRLLTHVIDNEDFVGQEEHQIALVPWPQQIQRGRLELEDKVVTERAVKAEMFVVGAFEQRDQRAQHRKDTRLAATRSSGKRVVVCGPSPQFDGRSS